MRFGLREAVFVLVLTVIPVVAWWLVFRPNSARNREMMAQIESKQEKLRALNVATGTVGDVRKEITALEKAMAFFHSKLPNEKEIDKVLQDVWRVAEANQLVTKSIRTVPRDPRSSLDMPGPQTEQPISMKLEGDFRGFYAFLLALENQPRITRIQRMAIRKPDKGVPGYVQAEFVMSIFFEAAPEEDKAKS